MFAHANRSVPVEKVFQPAGIEAEIIIVDLTVVAAVGGTVLAAIVVAVAVSVIIVVVVLVAAAATNADRVQVQIFTSR